MIRPTQMHCPPKHAERNARIMALSGTMTRAEIANRLDLSIGIVAGVLNRAARVRSQRRRARPPEVTRTIRLPVDLDKEIARLAANTKTSVSTLLREAARQAIVRKTALRQPPAE